MMMADELKAMTMTKTQRHKDTKTQRHKDKDKDKDKMTKRPNMCHIFENAMTQGCQI